MDKYTVMIYMVASSLEYDSNEQRQKGWGSRDIAEILAADIPATTNVILECGGTEYWDNPDVPDGAVTRFSVENKQLKQLQNLGRASMTDTGDLSSFITYCKDNYPAEKYVLVLWDHGGGYPLYFGVDYLVTNKGDGYDAKELGDELAAAGVHFDSLVFNACLMGSLEVCMSVKDYVDYMIGAESVVYAPDIEYTSFLTKIEDDTPYLETIIKEYENLIEERGLASSMSVLSLKRIDDVYDAYIQYLNEVKAKLEAGDYYNFAAARENCGEYSNTYCVDLVTLANLYPTDSSTKLINKITSAVDYTFSNVPYGRGLTVLFPYPQTVVTETGETKTTMKKYDYCRSSFVDIGYDPQIIDFFDTFMSQVYVAYNFKTSDCAWYKSPSSGSSTTTSSQTLTLTMTDNGTYKTLDIDPEDIKYSYLAIYAKFAEGDSYYYYNLGSEYKRVVDSNGADGNTTNIFDVYTHVNGEEAKMRIYQITQNGTTSVKVAGYRTADFAAGTVSDTLIEFKDTDQIILVNMDQEADGSYTYREIGADNPLSPSDISVKWVTINQDSEATFYGKYTLFDSYGNKYVTDGYYRLEKNTVMK